MTDAACIADPLSDTETSLLRAYVERDEAALAALADKGDAMRELARRGFVQIEDRGVLVTPEGVAAALM
jgi:hypothetical protein